MPELAKLIHGLGFSRDRPMNTNENAPESKLALASKVERDSNLAILSLEVAYNGAPFSGFARQPGQLTVQGSMKIFRYVPLLDRRTTFQHVSLLLCANIATSSASIKQPLSS